uniref:Si:ch1073-143l10.2 n=1 Tax=Stegastes partitus TaxID=144197 RepID=A0A3B4Z271_9TELE
MGSWKSHVRAGLQQRDHKEKVPFVGVFTSSELEDRFEIRAQILEDVQSDQTVSDLTTVLHLKEAELQHWVSQYRQEALSLAKGSNALKATLSELEFTVECQSKELAALRLEQKGLKEASGQACREKERLLQRWMEEKREEAERLNRFNDTQE